jgi:hypothetical protein
VDIVKVSPFGLLKQELERLLLGDAALQLGQAVRLLERAVELARRHAARLGHGRDAGVDLRLGGAEPLLLDQGVEDQVPLHLRLGDLVELLLERRELVRRDPVDLGVPVHQPVHQGLGRLNSVGLDHLGEECLPDLRIGVALRVAL